MKEGKSKGEKGRGEQRNPGPRRWTDDWVYKNLEKNQDRLFGVTEKLTGELGEVYKSIDDVRQQTAEVERRINKKFSWLYTLLIATLLGLVVNLAKDKLNFSFKSGVDEVVEQIKARKSGGKDGQTAVEQH